MTEKGAPDILDYKEDIVKGLIELVNDQVRARVPVCPCGMHPWCAQWHHRVVHGMSRTLDTHVACCPLLGVQEASAQEHANDTTTHQFLFNVYQMEVRACVSLHARICLDVLCLEDGGLYEKP